ERRPQRGPRQPHVPGLAGLPDHGHLDRRRLPGRRDGRPGSVPTAASHPWASGDRGARLAAWVRAGARPSPLAGPGAGVPGAVRPAAHPGARGHPAARGAVVPAVLAGEHRRQSAIRPVRRPVERGRVTGGGGAGRYTPGRAAGRGAAGRPARVGTAPASGRRAAGGDRPVAAARGRGAGSLTERRKSPAAARWHDQDMTDLVSLAEIERARDLLADVIRTTPLEASRPLSATISGPAWLKCENLQRAGSFKVRGAYVRIARLTDEERQRGVVAASAGNHAQGVALAARLCGTAATVYMPTGAPLPKIAATRGYGAEVKLVGHTVDEALEAAQEHAETTGAVLIHPFDHPDIIAGQGTLGLEILQQCPDVATIVVGVGGGGLISGIAAAVKAIRPEI